MPKIFVLYYTIKLLVDDHSLNIFPLTPGATESSDYSFEVRMASL